MLSDDLYRPANQIVVHGNDGVLTTCGDQATQLHRLLPMLPLCTDHVCNLIERQIQRRNGH
jgi:hypothetical protein